ncbi:MAG: hypothetical protein K2K21_11210 [Lachnospiraceae bacterium]|nr:hypothetical protein [Lachnospiraceae bacterium]
MKKFYLAVLVAALMSLTACGADRGSDSVQYTEDEEVVAAVEEADGTEAEENRIEQNLTLNEIEDDTDKEKENIAENTDDNADGIEEKNTENDTNDIDWEWFEKEDIDLSAYGLSEEHKELLKNLCWTVDDFTGLEEMDEVFWRNFLNLSYGAGWWREKERVSEESLATYRSDYSYRVSYEEVENYTQLVFDVEWPGIKPVYEEEHIHCYYEDDFYYFVPFDWFDKSYIITDCTVGENGTIYVAVQHSFNGAGGLGSGIIWETVLTLRPADNENGFILTAKQTERISESD